MKAPSFVLLLVGATSANQYACATMGGSTTAAGGEGFRAVGGTQIVSLYKVSPQGFVKGGVTEPRVCLHRGEGRARMGHCQGLVALAHIRPA